MRSPLNPTLPLLLASLAACGSGSFHMTSSVHGSDAERAHRTHEGTLALPSTPKLSRADVEQRSGSVTVHADAEGPITYVAEVETWAADAERAEEIATAIVPTFKVSPDGVRIRVEAPERDSTMNEGYSVDWKIHVPAEWALRVVTAAGDVTVHGPFRDCELETGFGDVSARHGVGEVSLRTSSGDVTATDIGDSPSLDAVTSFGDIELEQIRTERLTVQTSSGSIDLESADVTGGVTAVTSFGDIDVDTCSGNVELRTSSGDVTAERLSAGTVRATSNFGDVSVGGVVRIASVHSDSGDVRLAASPGSSCGGDWSAVTSFGDVKLLIPDDIAAELIAETSFGDISCDVSSARIESSQSDRSLRARLGDGGSTITARTSSGDITVRTSTR